jgi:hypothetical protein
MLMYCSRYSVHIYIYIYAHTHTHTHTYIYIYILTCYFDILVLGVGEPRLHLARSLHRLSVAYPGRLGPLLSSGLSDAERAYLKNYLDAGSVQLV